MPAPNYHAQLIRILDAVEDVIVNSPAPRGPQADEDARKASEIIDRELTADFFRRCGDHLVDATYYECSERISIEDLYRHFAVRLLNEISGSRS